MIYGLITHGLDCILCVIKYAWSDFEKVKLEIIFSVLHQGCWYTCYLLMLGLWNLFLMRLGLWNLFLSFDSPNSSTLTLFIDISLRGTFCQILISPYLYQWWGVLVLGKQFRRDQFIWLMQWAIARSGKIEKTRFSVTLLEKEAWRA